MIEAPFLESKIKMAEDLTPKKEYLLNLIKAIKEMDPNPFPFLCASTMIEYLMKLKQGYKGQTGYIKFVEDNFPSAYKDFAYCTQIKDLPKQMYYILRCGLVHSFSLVPSRNEQSKGARERSILLSHRSSAEGRNHLSQVSRFKQSPADAALFVLEDFCDDLTLVTEKIFLETNDGQHASFLTARWTDFPPILADV